MKAFLRKEEGFFIGLTLPSPKERVLRQFQVLSFGEDLGEAKDILI